MKIWSNLYRHHRWLNLTMVDFPSNLDYEQLRLKAPGTYGGSLATIRHVISSDADDVRIIPDAPRVLQIGEDEPFGGWMELRDIAAAADTALIDNVDGLADDAFFVDIDEGERYKLARWHQTCTTRPLIAE